METSIEPKKENKVKVLDPVGFSYYGDSFEGYQKVAFLLPLLPAFKEYYYAEKIKDPNAVLTKIMKGFNSEVCAPMGKKFHPYTTQLRAWKKKWDLDLMNKMLDKDVEIIDDKKYVKQIIKTRKDNDIVLGGASDGELEAGVRTLGGELLNDAMQMLKDNQELEDVYEEKDLIRRRNYIVNVFGHVTKLVHGKAALMLKASEEKRNNASFLMDILSMATAGKLTPEQMELLKNKPQTDAQH